MPSIIDKKRPQCAGRRFTTMHLRSSSVKIELQPLQAILRR